MRILFKRFGFFGQNPTIFLEILFDFLNGSCLIYIFLLFRVLVWVFHEFLPFECILEKLDSVVKIDVKSLHGLKLVFKFKNFLMKKFLLKKPLFLPGG